MPEQVEAATQEQLDQQSRELPDLIVIPSIKGEMVHLRPSVIEDLERMDAIGAYIGASGITGKDRVAERGAVHAWVRRSVAWSQGETPTESGVGIRSRVARSHGPSSPKPTMMAMARSMPRIPTM